MKTIKAWTRIAVISSAVLLLVACGGGGGGGSYSGGGGGGGGTNVTVPNVVGMTQAAATTSITGAGLTVGAVTMANSSTVAAGDVISENPAAGASVASGSAVALSVSSGPAQVAVPNVVGDTQAAATTAITGAGLKVGNVTMASSNSVPSGSVISENPVAGTKVAPASSVDLSVSSGPPPGNHFAYAANGSDATISAFSLNASTGALTALASSPITVTGGSGLSEIRIDPHGKFVYVVSGKTDQVYGFAINTNDGSLTAIAGSPFNTAVKPQSLVFDATGAFLYVLDATGNGKHSTIDAFSVDASTGVLTSLGTPVAISGGLDNPTQIVRAGNYLYVAIMTSNVIDAFVINADGSLTESTDPNNPYAADTGPFGLAADPSGTVLYSANNGSGSGSISSYRINADGSLTSFCAPNPCALAIPVKSDIGIDPQGKYLFVTEQGAGSKGQIDVYPIDASAGSLTGLGAAVAGSPFATGGSNPNAISFDASGQWLFSGHDSSPSIAEFSLNSATGALTAVAGSPVEAGNFPDFIAVD